MNKYTKSQVHHEMILFFTDKLKCPINQWVNLETLNLFCENLFFLPDKIAIFWKNIKYIRLSHNRLKRLPLTVGNWQAEKIYLSYNQLRSLPDTVGNWQANEIYLSNNQLKSLPETVGNWQANEIYLSNNQLRSLPETVGNWQAKKIYLYNNPLINLPPYKICKKCVGINNLIKKELNDLLHKKCLLKSEKYKIFGLYHNLSNLIQNYMIDIIETNISYLR